MMGLIVAFVIVHLTLVAIYPRTLVSMAAGRPADPEATP
jgi:thiosulfate reductase cytochrome b subunit